MTSDFSIFIMVILILALFYAIGRWMMCKYNKNINNSKSINNEKNDNK